MSERQAAHARHAEAIRQVVGGVLAQGRVEQHLAEMETLMAEEARATELGYAMLEECQDWMREGAAWPG